MPLDLGALAGGRSGPLLAPREIYAALPSRPWPYLRHEQGEVLERWFERREERDLVLKQITGGGKTAVGLLIARSSLNEGVAPVAYLAPDTYLVTQVVAEATRLGPVLAILRGCGSPWSDGAQARDHRRGVGSDRAAATSWWTS